MTIFGKKEVLFKVKPISETKEESYILSEGETVGNITVVSIDTTNAIISFLNNGTETTLGICYGTNSASAMAQPTLILDNTQPHFLTDADVTNYTAQSSFLERIKELRRESDGLPAPVPPIPLLQ